MKIKDLLEDINFRGQFPGSMPIPKDYNYGDIVNIDGSVNLGLEDLKTLPWKFGKITGDFLCHNNELENFDNMPYYVGGMFYFNKNKITSLVGIHKIIKYCPHIALNGNPIEEGGLGLLLIEGISRISSDHPAISIIAKYAGQGKKGMMMAHTELIEFGWEEHAKI